MTVALAVLLAALAGWCLPVRAESRLRVAMLRARAGQPMASPATRPVRARLAGGRWRAGRAAARRRHAVVELCQALSAELQSGAPPRAALLAVAEGLADFAALVPVARSTYADVPGAFTTLARLPGGAGLQQLAACWRLCEGSGAGLALAVGRVADALRDDEQVRREIAAQLAGPRATGVLLALLPIFGLMMGAAVGAQPTRVLLQTPLGLMLLVVAAALEALGLLWILRIARGAVPP